jgi:ABC-type nitrate/sulfonate/bicarbonate transport system substrate-binding protein
MASKQLLTFFCALCAFAASGFTGFCAWAQSLYPITAGGFGADAVPGWPISIAQEKMFFAKEGIQLEFIRTYEQMRALIGGSFDMILDGISTTILAAERGADIVVVYDVSHRPSEFITLARNIKALTELEGKTIGIGRVGTMGHHLLKKYLAQRGVDVTKVGFRTTGGSNERFAALYNGQISATLLSTAHAFRAQKEGMKIISLAKDLTFPWSNLVLRKRWAEANSAVVIRLVKGLHRATSWLYDPVNFHEAARILTKVTRLEENTMTWALKNSIENKVYNLENPNLHRFQEAVNWYASEGLLSKPFDASIVIDSKYYDQATR